MGAFNLIYTGKLENWNITKILRSENPFIGTFKVIYPRKLEYYEVKKSDIAKYKTWILRSKII